MAVSEKNVLHIHNQSRDFILLKGENRYHLISLSGREKQATIEKLLHIYPCSDAKLSELGFRFSAFRFDKSHRVVIQGYAKGDSITLWLGTVRDFSLGADYSDDFLTDFFEEFSITKRICDQKELHISPHVRFFTFFLSVFGVVCGILFWAQGEANKLWSCLCLLYHVGTVLLVLFSPDFGDFRYRRSRGHKFRKIMVYTAFAVSGFAIVVRTSEDFQMSNGSLGMMALISIFCVGVLIFAGRLLGRQICDSLVEFVSIGFLVALIGWGTVGQINYLMDRSSAVQATAVVQDLQKEFHTRGGVTYLCVVEFPDGKEQEYVVSPQVYRKMEIGGSVQTFHHSGGLGIAYVLVEPIQ